jgi:hypothetical protein
VLNGTANSDHAVLYRAHSFGPEPGRQPFATIIVIVITPVVISIANAHVYARHVDVDTLCLPSRRRPYGHSGQNSSSSSKCDAEGELRYCVRQTERGLDRRDHRHEQMNRQWTGQRN